MLNKLINTWFHITIMLLPVLCVKCSSPVSGVETGNPVMTACAKTALNLLSNNTVWQPESYLISGKDQLDPNSIVSKQPQSLSKRTASTDSTSYDVTKPAIVKRVDTIINVSKVYVNDTITRTSLKSDTSLLTRSDLSNDSATVITDKTVSELIFVVDTVFVYDTVTVTHYDTIAKWGEIASPNNTTSGNKVTIYQPTPTVTAESDAMNVYLKVISQSGMYSIPASFTSNTNETYSRISRSGTIASITIFEEYSDADGDGNLLSSTENNIPLINLMASYSLSNSKQSLSVRFDPGKDRTFSNTADNHIHSLHKEMKSGDVTSEKISYTQIHTNGGEENFSLTLLRMPQNDSVLLETTDFSLFVSDPASGTTNNSNELVKAHYAAQYQNRSLKSLDLSVIPNSKINATSTASKAALKIFVDYGKGSTGIFEGSVDYISKTVSGVYSENGNEFEFNYDGTSEVSDFEIKK
ncbi:MAG: hypothetical protein JW915_12145 [Chitinispirillaceae bacterium]|nr:hypothetical protein [Chitinispirillaceae bacterium]